MGDVYMVNGKILSGLPNHAKDIEFDNTGTTLSSTNTEDAIKEVNSNLSVIPDFSRVLANVGSLYSTGTSTYSYTATENCYVILSMVAYGGQQMSATVNDVSTPFVELYVSDSNVCVTIPVSFPIKKGDVLKVNAPQSSFAGHLMIFGKHTS